MQVFEDVCKVINDLTECTAEIIGKGLSERISIKSYYSFLQNADCQLIVDTVRKFDLRMFIGPEKNQVFIIVF